MTVAGPAENDGSGDTRLVIPALIYAVPTLSYVIPSVAEESEMPALDSLLDF